MRTRVKIFPLLALLLVCSCSSNEEPVKVGSHTITLNNGEPQQNNAVVKQVQTGPRVRVINIGPSKEAEDVDSNSKADTASSDGTKPEISVPKEFAVETALTDRLHDKLKEAYASRGGKPPDIEIYTGSQSLDQFAKHYEDQGYKILRTSVPAGQVIGPLLDEKPELASKISLANYSGININQVIVEGANISAADKYIDPVTYEIVYKTFVTVTKVR